MKSLVFPIIGSLVIGGGAITAPIYASFIEKAIEDSKEPQPIPIIPGNFETDSWDTVCHYANQGFESLSEAYHLTKEQFLNKKRKIVINGLEHEVRVIGVEEDYMDVDHKQPAALTFQFNNVITATDYTLWTYWDQDIGKDEDYWSSTIVKNLESDKDVTWYINNGYGRFIRSSIKNSVLKMMPNDVSSNIKPVYRTVIVKHDGGYDLVTNAAKVFLLSYNNLTGNETDPHDKEGLQYSWFVNHHDNADFMIKNVYQEASYYWLSSPSIIYPVVGRVTTEGNISSDNPSAHYPTAPCFCI